MAKVTDAKPEHRSYAARVPEDIRDRLTGEELKHRCEYAARIYDTAPQTQDGRGMMRHADKILRSLPLAEFLEQKEYWYKIAGGLEGSAADDAYGVATNLRTDNAYPAGMREAAESRLHGLAAGYPDADLDVILDHGHKGMEKAKAGAPKRKARPGEGYCQFCGDVVKGESYIKGSAHWGGACLRGNGRAAVEKAVSQARAELDRKTADLRKELNAYKAQIAADYRAAGRPVPPGFL